MCDHCVDSLQRCWELKQHVLAWIICRLLCDSMCDVTRSFSVCLSMALRDQSSDLCLCLSVCTLSASGSAVVPLHFLLVVWGSAAIYNTSHDHVYSSLQTCITLMHIYELINAGGLIWDGQTVTWNMFHITRWWSRLPWSVLRLHKRGCQSTSVVFICHYSRPFMLGINVI